MNGVWTTVDIAGQTADVYEPPGGGRARSEYCTASASAFRPPGLHPLVRRIASGLCLSHGRRAGGPIAVVPRIRRRHVAGNVFASCGIAVFPETLDPDPRLWGCLASVSADRGLRIGVQARRNWFPAVAGTGRPSNTMNCTATAPPSTRCTTARNNAVRARGRCAFIPAVFRSTCSFAATRTIHGFAAPTACTKSWGPSVWTHECDLETHAGGHSWRYFNSMAERAIRFLFAGLEQQSRRLLS